MGRAKDRLSQNQADSWVIEGTMSLSRRHFLVLSGTTVLLYGCGQGAPKTVGLPGMTWPELEASPTPTGRTFSYEPPAPVRTVARTTTRPTRTVVKPTPAATAAMPTIIAREKWTSTGPSKNLINPMNGVTRVTIHHEGAPKRPVFFDDERNTRLRLQNIQKYHMSRNWADVGYHYIIDRAGRIWEGRSVHYQGAHVKDHNEHNVGLMVLGNFDLQSPSDAQLITLQNFVKALRNKYNVPLARVRTHQELMPTACPGKNLQPKIASFRSNGAFG